MPVVYRVENNNGEGCYTARSTPSIYTLSYNATGNDVERYSASAFDRNIHKMPGDDSKLVQSFEAKGISVSFDPWLESFPANFRFGFASPEQYRSWFFDDKLLEELKNAGFRIYQYDVPEDDFIEGNSQCAFNRHSATCLGPLGNDLFHTFTTRQEEDYYDDQD